MADEQLIPPPMVPATLVAAQSQDHTPAVPSPLNPDASTTKPKATKPPPREREQREKKESLKKRESNYARSDTPTVPSKRKAASDLGPSAPSPMRYSIPEPRLADYDPPKETIFASHEPMPLLTPDGEIELKKPLDHAENKRGYRYSHCIADPHFRHKQYYRQTDTLPYGPRMSFEDTDKWIHYDTTGHYITNEKGWRMARANVCAREGTLYYEVRIVRGVPSDEQSLPAAAAGPQPHVRMGWARREAPLDAPVGFDSYSYGITDMRFETMHRSRPGKFFTPKSKKQSSSSAASKTKQTTGPTPIDLKDHIHEGDVIGLELTLPSLSLHSKIASGIYNPAVDLGSGFSSPSSDHVPLDIIRDRIPVPYKGKVYFETQDPVPSRAMEAYTERTLSSISASAQQNSTTKTPPNPNHTEPSLRTLPHSSFKVYKNGTLIGTAFESLLAFLPPASAPAKGAGAREGFDDGLLGYFPAVACFAGGVAECNFGDREGGFWCPPSHVRNTLSRNEGEWRPGNMPRPIGERYKEQIAEDVVWDIVDEVDFFMQDGGVGGTVGANLGVGGGKGVVASLREEVE